VTYKLIGGIGSRRRVAFACPVCGAELEAPLSDAGRVYPCPTCSRELVVPGADVLQREAESAAALAEQHRKAAAAAEPLPFAIPEPDEPSQTQAAGQRLDYAHSARPAADGAPGTSASPPEYRQLVTAARMVIVFAYLAFGLGVFGLVIAGVIFLLGLAGNPTARGAGAAMAFSLLFPSIGSIASGSVLYLFAHVGLAVRDIARNSFRQ
jgi:hypothetical protein